MAGTTILEAKEAYLYLKNEKYPSLRAKQRVEETIYFQTFNPFPNEDPSQPYITHKVKPARGRRIVDGPADWLAMDKVVCHIPPLGRPSGEETLKNKANADKKERWCQALLDSMAMRQPYYLRMAAMQLPLRGEVYLKVDTDWSYLLNPEDYGGIPFSWTVPDSLMVYALMDMDMYSRPMMVFEEKVHTLGHLKKLVAGWNKDKGVKISFSGISDHQDVTLVEWWTPENRGYFAGVGGRIEGEWFAVPVDGEESLPNLAGVVPYIRGFSPLGIWPYDGDITKLVIGFLRPLMDTIIQDARDRSKVDTITNYWAAPITSWIIEEGVTLETGDLIIQPGHVYQQIKGRKELKIEPAPPIPSSLIQQLAMNDSLLEEYDPMVLRGLGQPGETAVGQNQRVGLGYLKWEPLKITLCQMIANALSTTFKVIEEMNIPVRIEEKTIDKDDISGYYKNEIKIKPGNPEDQVRMMLLAKDLGDLYSEEDKAEKFLGEEDATTFVRKKRVSNMINRMLLDPNSQLSQMIYAQAIEELGLEGMETQIRAAANAGLEPAGAPQEGGIIGAHPTRGVPGVATQPLPAQPPSKEELDAAQNALGNIGSS